MQKILISFYKERFDLKEDRVYMRLEGLDETAMELFQLKPEERNARLVDLMKKYGVTVQIDRKIAEANGCLETFPPRETSPSLEKKADASLKEGGRIGFLCERTYRIISERMGEMLKDGVVNEKEVRLWFPVLFVRIETIEGMIDQEKDEKKVESLCDSLLELYQKIFDGVSQKIKAIHKTKKDIFDNVSSFLENKNSQATQKVLRADSFAKNSKTSDDDFFADDSTAPVTRTVSHDDDDVLGLL